MNPLHYYIFVLTTLYSVAWAHEEKIPWTEEKSALGNIEMQCASPGEIHTVLDVPGKIVFHPDRIAYVIPKVEGVVSHVYKNLGDSVDAGEVLAILESKEIAEAKAHYLAVLKKRDQKFTLLKSEERLQGISPKLDLLNAQLDAEESALMVDLARQNLYALGMTQSEIDRLSNGNDENLRFYQITSPIQGQVIQRNLTLGELVFDTIKAFTIAGFDKVWVEIALSQCDTCFLKQGLPIVIVSPQGKETQTTLYQFMPTIDEETRRACAIGIIDNSSGMWKVGEYVTVKVQADTTKAQVVVPKSAIQMIDGNPVVFIQDEEGLLVSPVCLGRMDENHVEILSGLKEGQCYVTKNSFVIKADLEKEEDE